MWNKVTLEFDHAKDENLDIINRTLAAQKCEMLELVGWEGVPALSPHTKRMLGLAHKIDVPDYIFHFDRVMFSCEGEAEKSQHFQIDTCAFPDRAGGDMIAFGLDWQHNHPDRIMTRCHCHTQDDFTVYVVVSRKFPGTHFDPDHIAVRGDWKTMEVPEADMDTVAYERVFSPEEMAKMRKGHVPESSMDSWFLYMEGNRLYVHRSRDGMCMYRLDISEDTGRHTLTASRDTWRGFFKERDHYHFALEAILREYKMLPDETN